jgi:replication factor A2
MYGGDTTASASQFAGGGFMPSDANAADGQTGARGSMGSQKKSSSQHTLRPVTVKQLRDCCSSADQDPDTFMVSGQQLHNIVVVGKVVSIAEQSTSVQLVIDDGTGKAEVKFWLDSAESAAGDQGLDDPHGASSRSEWKKGTYVQIFGHLRVFQGTKHIVAFTIRPIHDKNELTFHLLDCVYTHLHTVSKTQGSVQVTGQKRIMGPGAGLDDKPAFQQQQQQANPMANLYDANAISNMGMSPVQRGCYDAFHAPEVVHMDNGLSFNDLRQKLGNQFTEPQLRQAIKDLADDGHVYTTIDDNHFKGTGA